MVAERKKRKQLTLEPAKGNEPAKSNASFYLGYPSITETVAPCWQDLYRFSIVAKP